MRKVTQCVTMVTAIMALLSWPTGAIDFPNSHDMAVGGTLILSGGAPTALVNAPGCAIGSYLTGLEIGYDRQYDLSELDHLFIAGAVRHKRFSGALGLSQFGKSDLYAERIIKASATYSTQALSFGLSATLFQAQFGRDYGEFHTTTFGAGLGYRKGRFLGLALADNLTRPKLFSSAEPYPRVGSVNLEWSTERRLAILARAVKTERQKIRYGLGQRIPLTRTSSLLWGISTRPLEYGGGIDIGAEWFTFSYAAKIHPVLGFSHNVSILLTHRGHSKSSPGRMGDEFE